MTLKHDQLVQKLIEKLVWAVAWYDRVGGRVTPPVRPHHRAYGSVHGGSSAPLQIPELSQKVQESPHRKQAIVHGRMHVRGPRVPPGASPGGSRRRQCQPVGGPMRPAPPPRAPRPAPRPSVSCDAAPRKGARRAPLVPARRAAGLWGDGGCQTPPACAPGIASRPHPVRAGQRSWHTWQQGGPPPPNTTRAGHCSTCRPAERRPTIRLVLTGV